MHYDWRTNFKGNIIQLFDILLIMFSRAHEDRVKYWLTEAACQPLPDKLFIVTSEPNSKVYYCFIKSSGIVHKDWNVHE